MPDRLPPIHPGEHLQEFLEDRNMSANKLATEIGVPANRITGILNGTRGITGETALLLGSYFGTSAEMWMNLQKFYELEVARNKIEAEGGTCNWPNIPLSAAPARSLAVKSATERWFSTTKAPARVSSSSGSIKKKLEKLQSESQKPTRAQPKARPRQYA